MRKRIKVYRSGHCFIGKEVASDFQGEADLYPNALTLTIVKPNTSLRDVKRSLEIVLQDIELRIADEGKEHSNGRIA